MKHWNQQNRKKNLYFHVIKKKGFFFILLDLHSRKNVSHTNNIINIYFRAWNLELKNYKYCIGNNALYSLPITFLKKIQTKFRYRIIVIILNKTGISEKWLQILCSEKFENAMNKNISLCNFYRDVNVLFHNSQQKSIFFLFWVTKIKFSWYEFDMIIWSIK